MESIPEIAGVEFIGEGLIVYTGDQLPVHTIGYHPIAGKIFRGKGDHLVS
jgi:hypothetical protein